ncbi:ribonuclease H-like domain-containing protein [Tanacetum coccineum]
MIIRSQLGIVKLIDRLSLNTFSIFPIPKNLYHTLNDPYWRNAMYDEYNALVENDTCRYKARLVANGSSQQLGVNFDKTFSLVIKPATIRTVFSLAVSRQWPVHQLDVKNAFLNDDLSKTVYMHQPSGYATHAGFYHSRCDSSMFICRHGSQVTYLLIYVDEIILTASSSVLLQQIIGALHNKFDVFDLGVLNYFLGISATHTPTGLFLSYNKYALQLLELAHMVNCNPSWMAIDIESKLGPEGVHVHDPTLYHSLAGGYSI